MRKDARTREIENVTDAITYLDKKIKAHKAEYGEHGHYRNELIKLRNSKNRLKSYLSMI
jgi:hypothetical protein